MACIFALGYLLGFSTASISSTRRARVVESGSYLAASAVDKSSANFPAAACEGFAPWAIATMSPAILLLCSALTGELTLIAARSVSNRPMPADLAGAAGWAAAAAVVGCAG